MVLWAEAVVLWAEAVVLWAEAVVLGADAVVLWAEAVVLWAEAVVLWRGSIKQRVPKHTKQDSVGSGSEQELTGELWIAYRRQHGESYLASRVREKGREAGRDK